MFEDQYLYGDFLPWPECDSNNMNNINNNNLNTININSNETFIESTTTDIYLLSKTFETTITKADCKINSINNITDTTIA